MSATAPPPTVHELRAWLADGFDVERLQRLLLAAWLRRTEQREERGE